MTTREIFRRIMRFEKPDRTPLWQVEGIADRATLRWQAEGSLKPDQSPYEVIPFDGSIVTIPLNDQPPVPGFKEETLEETDVYVLYRDVHGSLIKVEPGPRQTPLNYVHVDGPLRMIGNISREALMKGRAAIEEEVRTKVPPLMAQGGYLPAFDDLLMPDMRFEDVLCCAELIRKHVS